MKIKATVDKYCYTSKPTDSDAKKMRMRLPQEPLKEWQVNKKILSNANYLV